MRAHADLGTHTLCLNYFTVTTWSYSQCRDTAICQFVSEWNKEGQGWSQSASRSPLRRRGLRDRSRRHPAFPRLQQRTGVTCLITSSCKSSSTCPSWTAPGPRLCVAAGTMSFTPLTCGGDSSLSSISRRHLTCAPLTLTSFSRLSRSTPSTCSMSVSRYVTPPPPVLSPPPSFSQHSCLKPHAPYLISTICCRTVMCQLSLH